MALLATLYAVLLVAAASSLAEVISLRPSPVTDLSAHVHLPREGRRFALGPGDEELDLLDIVLMASVDGKLHAHNRTSGAPLWSMTSSPGAEPAALGPLVRTQHAEVDPDLADDDSIHQEVYVIEPQSGDIYVMSSPDSPLQRLPFSVPQLVDMSPFSFAGEGDKRLFVGRKETSLLLIELETGRVKATLNPDECPWDPFEDLVDTQAHDLDLDELDGTKPPKPTLKPTEVFIGRTDYHLSIHSRPLNPSAVKPPVQKLVFSTYGPNNQDHQQQSLYRRTADNTYIQSLPNGEVISFRSAANSETSDMMPSAQILWGRGFSCPIVAAFDVVKSSSREHPFVLLQPRLRLEDLFPNVDLSTATQHLDSAFVGLVEETGSLFAMSPDRYPLVGFGDASLHNAYTVGRSIDPPRGTEFDDELPPDVDTVARRARARKLRQMCRAGSSDRRCHTGVRKLEPSIYSRLLDGAPTVPFPPYYSPVTQENAVPVNIGNGNASLISMRGPAIAGVLDGGTRYVGIDMSATQALSTLFVCVLALVVAAYRRALRLPTTRAAQAAEEKAPVQNGTPTTEASSPSQAVPNGTAAPRADRTPSPEPALRGLVPEAPRTRRKSSLSRRKVDFAPPLVEVTIPASGSADAQEDGADGEDSEKDGDAPATPGKRKGLRRKRGKKKKPGLNANDNAEDGEADGGKANDSGKENVGDGEAPKTEDQENKLAVSSSLVLPPAPAPSSSSLVVTDTILGFGSHGTVVFKGSLQGRAVAVKRLLQDFVTLASREVSVLQESDDHPNVIRYYYQEAHANFLYIALELCPASLADVVERPDLFRNIAVAFEPKRALRQITSGLRHLHALKIIHRDIKPQNILISHAKKGAGESAGHRMLISDFGLCKKLEMDQTSFLPTAHGAMAAGTVGWRAPEILRGEVKLDEAASDESQSSRGSVGTPTAGTLAGKPTRLTKSVDIFALGCLYYYVLTNGGHPFGERYEREVNILKNAKCLEGLERFGEEGADAADLIDRMLSPEAYHRPDTSTCLLHPYFWDSGKRLTFLQDASDRFEIMCRDPRDANLVLLETDAFSVVGNDWHARLDKLFIENLGKFRKYDGKSVQDLLRALRNKKHHYQDLPDNVKRLLGSMPEGFLSYFTRRFPRLFLHVHRVVAASSLRNESMFRTYFELTD
ncbi:hypothetical protein OBBRIDRAFT_747261 [Obba rivulosa]|uniref:non-specific serine/threonine protein kinase n=1 Tax=Obba rivulosa TaxID=1052685 RepID=A0A8E2J4S9_9APHY|nr:hypothetical protein OBBRIDRAFT_747261 [Obba rivulosa]